MGFSPVRAVPALRGWWPGVLLLGLLATLGVLLGAVYRWTARNSPAPTPPKETRPDPRVTYSGPFLNVRPDVKYVGDAACAGCHPIKDRTFHRHPMGRSIVPVAKLASSHLYRQPAPFDKFGSRFFLDRRGDRVWNRQLLLGPRGETLAKFDAEVHYVIGSGRRGHSYLNLRDGRVYQTSISWFSQKRKWDLSPGFQGGSLREIYPSCLFCHSGGVRHAETTVNRYEEPVFITPAIGCERCHGPGELHVKSRRLDKLPAGPVDPTIVNPHHLPPDLQEQVCQQCHLEGAVRILRRDRGLFDYRPGLPLNEFFAIFVKAQGQGEHRKAVGHVEQMHESKCYTGARGRMTCTNCHDPHEQVPEEQRVPYYRGKCLECHANQHPCAEDLASRRRVSPGDSCVGCHMPRFASADIIHTAATDHSIPRIPNRPLPPRAFRGMPLVPFHGSAEAPTDPNADRDLGLALTYVAAKDEGVRPEQLTQALELLDFSLSRDPTDVTLLIGLGDCLKMLGRLEEALRVFQRILELEPEQEWALREAARFSLILGRLDDALAYNQRALALNRTRPDNYFVRAAIYLHKRNWREALAAAGELLRLEPTLAQPYLIQAHCYEQLHDAAGAARAREKAAAVKTPDKGRLLEMFNQLPRD